MYNCDKVQNVTNTIAAAVGVAVAATAALVFALVFALALLNWAGGCGHPHGLCITLTDLVQ